jgi:hypothetical protein
MSMQTVQAVQSFVTYVAGDCVTVSAGQMVSLPKDKVGELVAGGLVLPPGKSAPETKSEPVTCGRVVSDLVPDPEDITDAEKVGTDDPVTGRRHVDPSIARARAAAKAEGAPHDTTKVNPLTDAEQKGKVNDPEGEGVTKPSQEGQAAKGAHTTGAQDSSSGPPPASRPVRTGQRTAKKPPRKSGSAGPKREQDDEQDDVATVGKQEPTVTPSGPNRDEPVADHPSPGTVDQPK